MKLYYQMKKNGIMYLATGIFILRTVKKTSMKSVRIYTSIDNVLTVSDYPGYTPETSTYGNGTTQLGVDYSTYPLSRRFTIGANITF